MDEILIHIEETAQSRVLSTFGGLPALGTKVPFIQNNEIPKAEAGERLRLRHYAAELRHIGMKHPQAPRVLENTAELKEPRHHVAHISVHARPLVPCRFGNVIRRISYDDIKRLVGQ